MSLKFTGETIGKAPNLYAVFHTSSWGIIKKNSAGKPEEKICSQRICEHLLDSATSSDAKQLREAISRLSIQNRRGDVNESTESLFAQLGLGH